MKVLVTNTVALNGGDAAILVAIDQHIRDAFGYDAEVTVHDSKPELAVQFYPNTNFRPITAVFIEQRLPPIRYVRRLLKLFNCWRLPWAMRIMANVNNNIGAFLLTGREREHIRAYLEADVIVSTGGTYLVEHYDLSVRLLEFEIIAASRKPWILYTQSLGPFRRTGLQVARALADSDAIYLRDEKSKRHLVEIDVDPAKCHVCHDVVFGLYNSNVLSTTPVAGPPRIAISVRNWAHFASGSMTGFRQAVGCLVQHLVASRGAEVVFLSTCQGISGYGFDDAQVAKQIVESLPEYVQHQVKVDSDYHHPLELQSRLREFHIVVATRMHMCILAMNAEVPVVNIAYEFKSKELFHSIGFDQWVVEIDHVAGDLLIKKVDAALAAREELQHELRRVLPKLKASADVPRHWLESQKYKFQGLPN